MTQNDQQNKSIRAFIREDRLSQTLLVSIVALSIVTITSFIGADYFDDIAERQYILESDPCDLTNYIEEGKKEQIRTFASFSFNYNNDTGNYDSEKVSFTITKAFVPMAEKIYLEKCMEKDDESD